MAIFVRGLPAARLCSKISGVGLRVYMGSKSKLQGFACLGFRASRLGKVSLLCFFLNSFLLLLRMGSRTLHPKAQASG